MKDPSRIPEILERIRAVWEQDPEQRLCQLLLNACRTKTPAWPDVFSVEDGALLRALEEYKVQLEERKKTANVDESH